MKTLLKYVLLGAALSSAVIGGTAAGIATGIETGDFDESMKSAALAGSEGYKWGAITGALTGGAGEAAALHGATASGLTMNQVAQIQRESKYPLDVIKSLKTMEQYDILKKAGVTAKMLKGKTALVRNIDLNFVDEMGRTNLARMQSGLAPLDPTGTPYELHHIGQKVDSTLAILTRSEHRMGGNHAIWHEFTEATENPSSGAAWNIPFCARYNRNEISVNDSLRYHFRAGSSQSQTGYAIIQIGNGTDQASANGTRGRIRMFGQGAAFHDIYTNTSANRNIFLPNRGGTIFTTEMFSLSGTTLTISTS